jgi:hypothetical protein
MRRRSVGLRFGGDQVLSGRMRRAVLFFSLSVAVLVSLIVPRAAGAETGYDAWLRYPPIADRAVRVR